MSVHAVSGTNMAAVLSSGVRKTLVSLCMVSPGCERASHTCLPQNVFSAVDGSEKHVRTILRVLFATG